MRPSVRRNSALNIAAFGISSAIGIAIVPVIINRFGLAALGMVAISRLMLPTGMAALLDAGLPEATTRLAAANTALGRHGPVDLHVRFSIAASCALGLLLAVALGFSAQWLSCDVFDIPPESCAIFTQALRWTAVALPLIFAGQIADAWFRGLENFLTIRVADVVFNVSYAIGVIAFATAFEQVIYLYLILLAGKACLLLGIFFWKRRQPEKIVIREELRALHQYAIAAWKNKAVSLAFRYLPQALVATLLGTASAGVFEALTRVPYFIKTALGVTTMALVPAAARVRHQAAASTLSTELGVKATAVIGLLFIPAQFTLAMFADHFLRLWLGPAYVFLAPWFSVMMIWPCALTCFQVMDSMLSIDAAYIERVAFASLLQMLAFLALSLALIGVFAEFAFVIGLAFAGILAVGWRFQLARTEGQPIAYLTTPLFGCLVCLMTVGALAAIDHWIDVAGRGGIVRSTGTVLFALVSAQAAYYFICLDTKGREFVRGLMRLPNSR